MLFLYKKTVFKGAISMNRNEIKKKLRDLKKREISIRTEYGQWTNRSFSLVWDNFFSEKTSGGKIARYDLDSLCEMSAEERKSVFDDYFFAVYIKHYKECGLPISNLYDPSLLQIFGLPQGSSLQEVKERFRILAHKYHPDKGGDVEIFRTFLEAYEKIKGE